MAKQKMRVPKLIAVTVLGCALAVLLGGQALSSVLTRSAPNYATAIFAGNGLAREQEAFGVFQTAFTDNQDMTAAAQAAEPLALRSIADDPLTPKNYTIAALAKTDPEMRAALLEQASRLNRRDLSLQGLVLQERLGEENYPGVIETLDQILRVHPDYSAEFFAVLLDALRKPEAASLFPDILTGAAPWHETFLRYAVRDPDARTNLAVIRDKIAINDDAFDRQLISGLADQGEVGAAQRLYAALNIPASSPSDTEGLNWNSDFPPFDWELADERNFRAQSSRDGARLELFVQSGQGGVIARRVIAAPKSRFTIETNLDLEGADRPEAVRMVVRCSERDENSNALYEGPLANGPNTLAVDQPSGDCQQISLAIVARSLRGETTLRGELTPITVSERSLR